MNCFNCFKKENLEEVFVEAKINENPTPIPWTEIEFPLKAFIDFSIIRAVYGFSIVGLGYLITEVLDLEFNLRTVLLPIAIIAFSNRLFKYYRNNNKEEGIKFVKV